MIYFASADDEAEDSADKTIVVPSLDAQFDTKTDTEVTSLWNTAICVPVEMTSIPDVKVQYCFTGSTSYPASIR